MSTVYYLTWPNNPAQTFRVAGTGGGGGGGSVTQINTVAPLSGGPITDTGAISLLASGVTAGSYSLADITVDAFGRITAAASGSSSITIGIPTSGSYGNGDNPMDLQPTDTIADAFNKVVLSLDNGFPGPPALSTFGSIDILGGTYSAIRADASDTLVTRIQNHASGQPSTTTIGGIISANAGFGYAESGTLTAMVRNSPAPASAQGTVAITTANITGNINGYITTINKFAYETGSAYGTGFRNALNAVLGGVLAPAFPASNTELYSMQLMHSTSGSTNIVTFYQDNAIAPSISAQTISAVTASTNISGVPGATAVTVSFIVSDAIRLFYNSVATAIISGTGITTTTQLPTGANRNSGSNPTFTFTGVNIAASQVSSNFQITCTGRNSVGTETAAVASGASPVRVDRLSNESSRYQSGVGQFPGSTHNPTTYALVAFNSATSLAAGEELQMLNGFIVYPPAVNYATFLPVGPNYSALAAGSYLGYRWVTYSPGSVVDASSVTITLNGASGLGTDPVIPSFAMYVLVNTVTGWLDGNAAYNAGTPTNDGDAALDYGISTATVRRVTFGPTTRTGTVIVRIGFPTGLGYTFSSISMA